jgi:hypothetical protein
MTRWFRVHFHPPNRAPFSFEVRASNHSGSCPDLPRACGGTSTGLPFDTGLTAIQSLFTGTIAKVASRVAIVTGG